MSGQKRFRTVHSVRAFVARQLKGLEVAQREDAGNHDRARVMIYGAKVLAELIDRGELEQRIRAIEERLNGAAAEPPEAH